MFRERRFAPRQHRKIETKKDFWMSRPAYRNFPLKEVQDNIDQEVGTEKCICQIKEKGKKLTYRYT